MALGLVLTPYGYVKNSYPFEINKSGPSIGSQLCPADPYYFQRGEYGFFHDTPFGGPRITKVTLGPRGRTLGAIPTDAEIGEHYYSWYTPVQSAWVYAKDPKRFIPPPWVPPRNRSPIGPFGPRTSLRGTGLGAFEKITDETAANASTDAIVRLLEKHHRDQFMLSALGTAGTVLASAFAIYRTIQGIKDDSKHRTEEAHTTIAGRRR